MSIAKDDIGLLSSLNISLESNIVKSGTVNPKVNIDKNVSDLKTKESEISDVYEKKYNTNYNFDSFGSNFMRIS